MKGARTWLSLEAFYADDERRRHSGEVDYGVWWKGGRPFPHYRVSYIEATGEVYAVALQVEDAVILLGTCPRSPGKIYYRLLDKALEGWPNRMGDDNGLDWIRERLAVASSTPEEGDPYA